MMQMGLRTGEELTKKKLESLVLVNLEDLSELDLTISWSMQYCQLNCGCHSNLFYLACVQQDQTVLEVDP